MPAATHRSTIFLSSVQKELQTERRALKDFVHGDPLLSQFFEVFLFEDIPVSSSTTQATPQDKPLLSIVLDELALALGQPTTQVTTQVAEQVGKLLRAAAEPATREHLQDAVGLQNREHFRQTYLEPLLTARWLERTIPDKPTSPHQRYLRTATGAAWLARLPT
ncbi:MAG: hypothetical protein HZA93_19750 [Verrucomicrobia bacterium]|nr:hypothetical protein [Verrucomicrobiota bacterium]